MRVAAFGLVVLAVLVAATLGISSMDLASAQQPSRQHVPPAIPVRTAAAASAGDLIAFSSTVENGPTQVMVIDAKARVMTVYQIDRITSRIELKSVRNVNWDLRMEEFNGVRPLPREIRELLEQR